MNLEDNIFWDKTQEPYIFNLFWSKKGKEIIRRVRHNESEKAEMKVNFIEYLKALDSANLLYKFEKVSVAQFGCWTYKASK